MKIEICRRYLQIFAIISVLSFSNLVFAETVVHNERVIQQDIQKKKEIAKAEQEKRKKEELERQKAEEERKRKEDLERKKEQEEKQRLESKNKTTINDNEHTVLTSPKKTDEKNSHKHKINESNTYFRDFTVDGPKLNFNHGEGGDLAKTSSNIWYSTSYRLTLNSEFIDISVNKMRTASAFGSDTYSTFFVLYNLKFNPHVSKKRLPKIEIITDHGSKIIEFKKISNFRSDGFHISTGDDFFLDRFYFPGCNANLLLENKNGDILRVPLPAEVIEQWHQVGHADLRKVKREYEDA